jgi:hypothetical protein
MAATEPSGFVVGAQIVHGERISRLKPPSSKKPFETITNSFHGNIERLLQI